MKLLSALWASREYPKDLQGQKIKPLYPSQYDVILKNIFGDIVARYPWHYSNKPDKRNKYVMHNCIKRPIIWD